MRVPAYSRRRAFDDVIHKWRRVVCRNAPGCHCHGRPRRRRQPQPRHRELWQQQRRDINGTPWPISKYKFVDLKHLVAGDFIL